MPDAGQTHDEVPREVAAAPRRRASASIFADPLVRTMALVAAGLVILFLLITVSALLTGVFAPTGPRTLAEKEVAVSGALVREGVAGPIQWGEYIAALIANGEYGRARSAINEGRASVDDTETAEFTVAEVRLDVAQKKFDDAVELARQGQKVIKSAYDARIAAGGDVAKKATASGMHENYYVLALLSAYAYGELGQWPQAVEQFDVYLAQNPTASDILVDRADAKAEAGDIEGAEADYLQALKFVPYDEAALAGLKKIGADK